MIKSITKLFKPLMIEGDDTPMKSIWAGSEGYAAYFDPNKGRLYATLWDDSTGWFVPTIYVSVFTLFRIRREPLIRTISFRGFPRCAIELGNIEAPSMRVAKQAMKVDLRELKLFS